MEKFIVTAILNGHREGMTAVPSMESLKRTISHAEESGHAVEVIIVLDKADPITTAVIEETKLPHHKVYHTEFGDLGLARNFAISRAHGEFIALLDADDLWGVDWLKKAIASACRRTDKVVWHPAINIYFGAAKHIFAHVDMEDSDFEYTGLLIENYWTSLSFARREIYLETPYPKTDLKAGIGFEDWSWNMETICRGAVHKVVPGTGHVIRRKTFSLAQQTSVARAVPKPNDYLGWVMETKVSRD